MRPVVRSWLIGALSAVLLLGGCGIPDNTDAQPVGAGPPTGTSSSGDVAPVSVQREDTLDKRQFVQNYLMAAAGVPGAAPTIARVKSFLSPEAAASFKPQPPVVQVIHLVEEPLINPGSDEVTFRAQQVGALGDDGVLEPTPDAPVTTSKIVVAGVDNKSGLFVTSAPSALLLRDTALGTSPGTYYEQRTIYFWNTEHTALVPDIRYMSKSVPPEQQPNVVLGWLTGKPALWLTDAVEALPKGAAGPGNVPAVSNDKLQINLAEEALQPDDKGSLDRLRRQLMWSLGKNLPRVLELKIGHEPAHDYDQTDYLTSNASYRLTDDPERAVVYDNQIRRLKRSPSATEAVPLLQPGANRNVRSAALSSSNTRTYAALVVKDGGKDALRVAAARTGEQAALKKVTLSGPLGRPVWAVTPEETKSGATGLITANGRLYSFNAGGGKARQLEWPGGPGQITAVAVAPDAHRLALVVGGQLYLAVLVTGGDRLQISGLRRIRTPIKTLTAVDWSSEAWLVVAGTRVDRGRVTIMDVSIDGLQQSARLLDLGSEPVTALTAYPASPVTGRQNSESVAYVQGGAGYNALTEPVRITIGDLAEPVANPPAGVAPTEPLFLR
jgi:lipoprotein LpqB-like beta-propeller protein